MAEPMPLRPVLARVEPPPYDTHLVLPGVFSGRQCDRIIEIGLEHGVEAAGLEHEEAPDGAIRRAGTAWIPPTEDALWIYRKLAGVAGRANRRYRFDLTGFEEDLQFTVYDRPGSFYTWHQDGLDGTVGHRKLSMVVQLSDPTDYSGAELELFQVSADSSPEDLARQDELCAARGTVVVFPSFEYHRVRPLRSGRRYSLVSWVSGPPFR